MKRFIIISALTVCLSMITSVISYAEVIHDANEDKVSGKVTSENGEPLPGTFISIKGTKTAVQSDLDGYWSIAAPAPGKSYTL